MPDAALEVTDQLEVRAGGMTGVDHLRKRLRGNSGPGQFVTA